MREKTDSAQALPQDTLRVVELVQSGVRCYDHLSREVLIAKLERRDRERARGKDRIKLTWAEDRVERNTRHNGAFATLRLVPELCDRAGPWEKRL